MTNPKKLTTFVERYYEAMIKEDYLLRIIQELGRKIAELLDKRTKGKTEEGIVLANVLFREYTGHETEKYPFLLDEEVVKQWSAQQTDLMADAASETALLYMDSGDAQRADNFKQIALFLYREAERKDKTYSFVREEKRKIITNTII